MIYLYSGTPGSGKSLHMAKVIYTVLKRTECLVICNFMINEDCFTDEELKRFIFLDNNEMIPDNLVRIAEEYWSDHKAKSHKDAESRIRLFIDESQILFNARDWQKNYSLGWTNFFSVHRHYGFEVVLCTQIDTNLDKQVRALIETQCIHRKIENIGAGGRFVSMFFGGGLFYCVVRWYPMHEKVDGYFFTYQKKFAKIYDTHMLFNKTDNKKSIIQIGA